MRQRNGLLMHLLAHPWALWLLLAIPALVFLLWRARRGSACALRRFGNVVPVHALLAVRPGARTLKAVCLLTAITLLIVASAGPQWGRDRDGPAVAGRDLVVVLDLSRSMLAEKPSRQVRAQRALHDLCDALQERGGGRVALVIFAARAGLAFPLTHDCEHLRSAAAQLDADALPAEYRPDAGMVSGTRIGQGIAAAVAAHDTRFAGAQDILLVSDGDDPAHDDEWKQGIAAAIARQIPVHTLSIGDPDQTYTIPYQGEPLRHQGSVVKTTVREEPLRSIAAETGGIFIPEQTKLVPLGKLYREAIEPLGQRRLEAVESASLIQRFAWFLLPALVLFAASMAISERRSSRRLLPQALAVACASLLLLGSEPLPREAGLIRAANVAFGEGEFEKAIALYTRAAVATNDPGLVSLNKGAAFYRLQRFGEAERHFRQCLDDQASPPLRKARCLYDLGNALLRQESTRARVEEALFCYEACLKAPVQDAHLRGDAEHNLAIARELLAKLPPAAAQNDGKQPQETPGKGKQANGKDPSPGEKKVDGKQKPEGGFKEDDLDLKNAAQKMAAGGKLLNLPDDDRLTPLSPTNTRELLEREIQRMLQGRRDTRRATRPLDASVKDW